MKTKAVICLLMLLGLLSPLVAQETFKSRSTFLSAGTLQLKESANYGLVFGGPSLNYGRKITNVHNVFTSVYEFELGLATPLAHDIIGVNFHLKPVDLFLGLNISLGDIRLLVGPAFRLEYNAQFYPDLQSGYDYWLTELSLGLAAQATIPAGSSLIGLKVRNSATGLVCRNEIYTDPYFFDLGFFEVLKDLHQNGRTFGPGRFNSTSLEINFRPGESSRISFALCADYAYYCNDPALRMLNQSVRIYFHPKY